MWAVPGTRMWYRVNTDDERAMDSPRPSAGLASGRAAPGGAVDDPAINEPIDVSGLRDRPTGGPASSGLSVGDPDSDETSPVGDPVDGSAKTGGTGPAGRKGQRSTPAGPGGGPSTGDQSADDPVGELPTDSPVDDLPDDGPAEDGGGMSPVVREYVEGLRREALARDAELRARGIDPYKGTGVDEGLRRRLGARALVALVVLVVAAVSVGAYVVFFRGEPDYGMSHGYQVQSDGSLKRPPVTDKAPDKPAEMSKGDEAGAAAAARYYLKAYSYAWNTGDTAPIKAISDEECAFCQREIAQIDEFYSNGYWATGTYASITNTDSIDRVSDDVTDAAIYDVQFHIDEHTPQGYSSKGYESGSRYDTIIKFRVQWKESEWRVVDGRAVDADAVS